MLTGRGTDLAPFGAVRRQSCYITGYGCVVQPPQGKKRCCCLITPICLHNSQVPPNIEPLDTKGGRVPHRYPRCGHRRSKGPGNSQVPVLPFVSTLESGTAVPTDGESRRQIMPTMLSAA